LCADCNSTEALPQVIEHQQYVWAKTVTCGHCRKQWYNCTFCPNTKNTLTGPKSLYDHDRNKHNKMSTIDGAQENVAVEEDTADYLQNSSHDYFEFQTEESDIIDVSPQVTQIDFSCFSSGESVACFEQQSLGLGASYLVSQAQFHDGNFASMIHSEEVHFHLKVAHLVASLTRGQRDALARLFQLTSSITQRQQQKLDSSTMNMSIPCSPSEMRSLYYTGKYALLCNLPRPTVTEVEGHAYVSLHDYVADLLGHGMTLNSIEDICIPEKVSEISECAHSKSIFRRGIEVHGSASFLCLYLIEWSDGFEPAHSTKANRGSCWIKTVTISPTRTGNGKMTHTYPIALGVEADSHECIEKLFAEELNRFKVGENVTFYHGGLEKNVVVYLEVLLVHIRTFL
jgi:hypothetical protein